MEGCVYDTRLLRGERKEAELDDSTPAESDLAALDVGRLYLYQLRPVERATYYGSRFKHSNARIT